jgi:hypothetical protein
MIRFFTPYHLKMFGTKSDPQVRNTGVAFPAPSSTSSQSNHRGGAIITDQVELKQKSADDCVREKMAELVGIELSVVEESRMDAITVSISKEED